MTTQQPVPIPPEPDARVTGGGRTADGMTPAWIAVTHLADEGYGKIAVERKAQAERALAGSD
ncbi:MAG: hypothetical protein HQ498_00400 [Pseudohongiella sp.]|nr:hypothetical protein [Pseudohongiella sp.]